MARTRLADFRVAVVGSSGSGKSAFAARLAQRLAIPHVELDAIAWRPGWVLLSKSDPAAFIRLVQDAAAADSWVADGNYSLVQPLILARATHLVWLDYGRSVIMPRVLKRSFLRALSPRELWPGTGNREDFRRWLRPDHPIRWTWDNHARVRARYAATFADPARAQLTKHRLARPRDAARLLARLTAGQAAADCG